MKLMKRNSNKLNKIRLGVNLDHVATLRQVRGGTTSYPDILLFVKNSIKGGADQITIHLREDRRHIQETDLAKIVKASTVAVNLEMAATEEMTLMALKYEPDYICLVPEKRQELTTEGGLNVAGMEDHLKQISSRVKQKKIKVSTFIDPSIEQAEASHRVGADAVEFHTGHWVRLKGGQQKEEWGKLVAAANRAHELKLQVHAGHGLDYGTTKKILKLPHLEEVNIGHFLVCEALSVGMEKSVREMSKILKKKNTSNRKPNKKPQKKGKRTKK
jgi:pyridoxine 5-phosphate synthase